VTVLGLVRVGCSVVVIGADQPLPGKKDPTMLKLAALAAALIIAMALLLACLLPGITDGFRYFIVMAGIVMAALSACGIVEARDA
jgi:hypothetical protein